MSSNLDSQVPGAGQNLQVPPGQTLKMIAGDPRTTNLLLAVLVLCMSGLMPEQFSTLCS
jgi:hypothetical protein